MHDGLTSRRNAADRAARRRDKDGGQNKFMTLGRRIGIDSLHQGSDLREDRTGLTRDSLEILVLPELQEPTRAPLGACVVTVTHGGT